MTTPATEVVYTYARRILRAAGFTGDLRPQALRPVFKRLTDKYAPSTVRICWAVVRSDMFERDIDPPHPRRIGVPSPGHNVPHWNVLQKGQIGAFVAAAKTPLEKLVVTAILLQGWRASELASIRWGDLHGDVVTFTGKGGKTVDQRVKQEVIRLARVARTGPGPESYHQLVPVRSRHSVSAIVRRVAARAGMRVTPHGLRATFISQAIAERGIEVARQLARHEFITTTQRYSRWRVIE